MKIIAITIFVFYVHTTLSISPDELQSLEEQPASGPEKQAAPRLEEKSLPRSLSANDNVNYDVELDDGKITYKSNAIDQSYSYSLETSDGTSKHEAGHFEDEENLVVEGGYEYIDANGVKFSVSYVADKNGYRPKVSFGTNGAPRAILTRGSARALKEPEEPSSTTAESIEPAVTEVLPVEDVQ